MNMKSRFGMIVTEPVRVRVRVAPTLQNQPAVERQHQQCKSPGGGVICAPQDIFADRRVLAALIPDASGTYGIGMYEFSAPGRSYQELIAA